LTLEFGNLDLDRRVIEIWDNELTTDEIAEKLEAKPTEVAASISRLGSRGLLKYEELVAA
jgi:Mn-dependent DtxR family transcriptional regulator